MERKISLITFFYIITAVSFFVVSFKFSGAEAYHNSGILTYFKWAILGILLNVGFVFYSAGTKSVHHALVSMVMFVAMFVNVLIYSNPNHFLFFDLLAFVLAVSSFILLSKKSQVWLKSIH